MVFQTDFLQSVSKNKTQYMNFKPSSSFRDSPVATRCCADCAVFCFYYYYYSGNRQDVMVCKRSAHCATVEHTPVSSRDGPAKRLCVSAAAVSLTREGRRVRRGTGSGPSCPLIGCQTWTSVSPPSTCRQNWGNSSSSSLTFANVRSKSWLLRKKL